MGADGVGSSVILALAAVLWLAYLVPSMLRRREYLSTERNALRLQQTLRVMAETAELPEPIRVESTARGALQQEKLLHKQQRQAAAVLKSQNAAIARSERATMERTRLEAAKLASVVADVAPTSLASRRLRRSRLMTTLVLVGATVIGGFFLVSGSWLPVASCAVVVIGALALLSQMASVSRARKALAHGTVPVVEPVEARPAVSPARAERPWTPVPVPKPLYLSRPQVSRAVDASLQAAAELRQAAADAERKLREAHEAPEVAPLRPASRFASMGIVDPSETGAPDLDAALRRRRA